MRPEHGVLVFSTTTRNIALYQCGHLCCEYYNTDTISPEVGVMPFNTRYLKFGTTSECPSCTIIRDIVQKGNSRAVYGCDLCVIRVAAVVGWNKVPLENYVRLDKIRRQFEGDVNIRQQVINTVRIP